MFSQVSSDHEFNSSSVSNTVKESTNVTNGSFSHGLSDTGEVEADKDGSCDGHNELGNVDHISRATSCSSDSKASAIIADSAVERME